MVDYAYLALNYRLQVEQAASQILFSSERTAVLLMRRRQFVHFCASCFQDSIGILKSFSATLRVCI